MTHRRALILCLGLSCLPAASATAAECYADYKARRDTPEFALHYGVIALQTCDAPAARAEVADRLKAAGWTLLDIVSLFGPKGLPDKEQDAGPYYLLF